MTDGLRIVLDARATTAHFPGVARATLGLLDGLRQLDHPHHLAVLAHAGAPPVALPAFSDPRVSYISTAASPLGLAQHWQLPLLARTLRPALWHAPYYIRPFIGVPRPVVTVYDVIGHVLPEALPSRRARLLFEVTLRLSLRTAAQIIVSSQATQRDLVRLYRIAPERITSIPLAAAAHFQPQSAAQIRAVRERYDLVRTYLLYVGSNKPHKNLPLLVRAFAQVETDATLVIAGRWDARYPHAKQLAQQLGLAERVRFIHDIADADLPALLTGAVGFVFPSRYEGFGLPPLEALQCGVPVIAANTSALPEVIGNAGLLVTPEPEPLAEAVQTLLADTALREQLRARGLARARQFSWIDTARQTVAVYEQVAQFTTP